LMLQMQDSEVKTAIDMTNIRHVDMCIYQRQQP